MREGGRYGNWFKSSSRKHQEMKRMNERERRKKAQTLVCCCWVTFKRRPAVNVEFVIAKMLYNVLKKDGRERERVDKMRLKGD